MPLGKRTRNKPLVLSAGRYGVVRGRSFRATIGKAHQNEANDNQADNDDKKGLAGGHIASQLSQLPSSSDHV